MKFKSLLVFLLALVCFTASGQKKIVVEKAGQSSTKEIDFTKAKPDLAQKPDPIPGMNDDLRFDQILSIEVISLEGGYTLEAYLNSTNGVFGYSGEMMRVGWKNAPQTEETDHIKFVAYLPNADALMYTDTPETGKIAMKMGSGMSMVSANFDRWNGSQNILEWGAQNGQQPPLAPRTGIAPGRVQICR